MRRSKILFFIAAAIVVALILVIVFLVNPQGDGPTVPTGESDPADGTIQTEPPGSSYPVMTGTLPVVTEPTYPRETFVPDEDTPSDLPESNGAAYRNWGTTSIKLSLMNYQVEKKFSVSFGIKSSNSRDNYIYLNPTVEWIDGEDYWQECFMFTFRPSAGYVTTITDAEPGEYVMDGNFTFVRALDYALPCNYVSDEYPGAVWYLPEGEEPEVGDIFTIDTCVFYSYKMMASLRIHIRYGGQRGYSIIEITNLNQLDDTAPGDRYQLSDEHLKALVEAVRKDAYDPDNHCDLREESAASLDESKLIIEWREQGKGTYYDYATKPNYLKEFVSSEELGSTPLVAVTLRSSMNWTQIAPVTLYYRILEGAAEDGGPVYELVGIDQWYFYYSYYLYYGWYPGYSLPNDDT